MQLRDIVAVYSGLGDPVRLRILSLLDAHKRRTVGVLCATLKLPQSTVSRQLGILRHAGLVQVERDGRFMHYSLDSAALAALALGKTLAAARGDCAALRKDEARSAKY